ncbi:MAG: dephospho-CoA kinase, partial [Acidimicrobiales bacterium]
MVTWLPPGPSVIASGGTVRVVLSLGLTGGIGSGKSTVSAILEGHGAVVVDADRIVR